MDINDLLLEKNLEPDKLMPCHRPSDEMVILNAPGEEAAPFHPFLPLHYFDNEDYEVWTPQEWLNKGVSGKHYKPLPATALLPNVDSNLYSK
jgi:dynein heavy chain